MTEQVLVLPPETPIGNEGRYVVKSLLGQGGFSVVYLARDTMLGADVVVKEFYPKDIALRKDDAVGPRDDSFASAYADRLESFCSEAKLLAGLSGTPGIPSIRDVFKFNGTAYIVTAYTAGKSLAEYLDEKGGQIGWIKTSQILSPVAETLKILHGKGIIHKDISPSNILVTDNGGQLLDLGAAVSSERMLKHGYAPIELYSGNVSAGPAADIYSMAATAYKCLTGITPAQAVDRGLEDTLQPPSSAGSDISAEAEALLMNALAVRPGDRMSSDDELIKLFNIRTVTKAEPKTASRGNASGNHGSPKAAGSDGPTVVLPQEQAYQSTAEGEVTVVLDCSQVHDYTAYEQQPVTETPTPNPQSANKSSEMLNELAETFGKAPAKIREIINANPAKFKKIVMNVAILLFVVVVGATYYNTVYLKSFGVMYGKALDLYDRGNYQESSGQLEQTEYMHSNPDEKERNDISYLEALLALRGYPVILGEDPGCPSNVLAGPVSQENVWVTISKKFAEEGDMRHTTLLAELCFLGSQQDNDYFFSQIGLDQLKKCAKTIEEKKHGYQHMSELNKNISERLFASSRDGMDDSITDEAIAYMKKAGCSDEQCERARSNALAAKQNTLDTVAVNIANFTGVCNRICYYDRNYSVRMQYFEDAVKFLKGGASNKLADSIKRVDYETEGTPAVTLLSFDPSTRIAKFSTHEKIHKRDSEIYKDRFFEYLVEMNEPYLIVERKLNTDPIEKKPFAKGTVSSKTYLKRFPSMGNIRVSIANGNCPLTAGEEVLITGKVLAQMHIGFENWYRVYHKTYGIGWLPDYELANITDINPEELLSSHPKPQETDTVSAKQADSAAKPEETDTVSAEQANSLATQKETDTVGAEQADSPDTQQEADTVSAEQANSAAKPVEKTQEAKKPAEKNTVVKSAPAEKPKPKAKAKASKPSPTPQQTMPQQSGRMTLEQKAAQIRKEKAQREAAEKARIMQRAE